MRRPTRRRLLQTGGAVALGTLAGCAAIMGQSDTPPQHDTNRSQQSDDASDSALTDWERSTDCNDEPTRLYDSVISVKEVTTTLESTVVPIHFSTLSAEEQTILRSVTEDGGYGTCTTSEAFRQFVDRVTDHTDGQSDGMTVYLERDGIYYRLYVEVSDLVYAY